MGDIFKIASGWEYYISRAEIEYKNKEFGSALQNAKIAKNYADTKARKTAIGIFIAKCHSALGQYDESSKLYRELIKEDTYLPPVLMGMMYNNLETRKTGKVQKNITLVKVFAENDNAD
jgi:tetratricopeptide (TPR) repeat protein